MRLKEQKPDLPPAKSFRQQIAQREKVAKGLLIFLPSTSKCAPCTQYLTNRCPSGGAPRLHSVQFRLRDGETSGLRPEMQIKGGTEQLHAHGAALDVPPRTAFPPWLAQNTAHPPARVPSRARNPPRPPSHTRRCAPRSPTRISSNQFYQLSVLPAGVAIFFDAKIDGAIGGYIGQFPLHQLCNQFDDLGNVIGRARRL